MAFTTDIVAIDLRRYPHSPALLADLAREGYELFDHSGMVLFRKHNRLASRTAPAAPETVAASVPEAPPAPDAPAE